MSPSNYTPKNIPKTHATWRECKLTLWANELTFVTWPLPRPMLNWPLLEPYAHVALKWWILHNSGRLYDETCPAQSLEIHPAEGPILGLWPDLDLTLGLKIKILSAHLKRLVASFRLPTARLAAAIGFSGYRLGALNTPFLQQVVGGEIPQQLPGKRRFLWLINNESYFKSYGPLKHLSYFGATLTGTLTL